ncbi:MAG: hypothetical protein IMW99_03555 [Firmicutes bacterium]|nr:hypothetical protein [Bacillota bacterium]
MASGRARVRGAWAQGAYAAAVGALVVALLSSLTGWSAEQIGVSVAGLLLVLGAILSLAGRS